MMLRIQTALGRSRRRYCSCASYSTTSRSHPAPRPPSPPTTAAASSGDFPADPSSYLFPTPSAVSTFGADPELLQRFLRRKPTSITIRQLLALSPPPTQSHPPTLEQLLHSAHFTSTELPIRLSHRVADFRALPFIVASNPYISRIAQLYASGFDTLARFCDPQSSNGPAASRIQTVDENAEFARLLEDLIDASAQNVPTLARGFLECEKYMSKNDIAAFLDAAIHSRIAIRLIGEQHLALTDAISRAHTKPARIAAKAPPSSSVGVIDTALNPARIVKMCASYVHDLCEGTLGAAPQLIIEGDESSTYAGCGQHLEYIMTELLKNSYRATTERWLASQKRARASSSSSSSSSSKKGEELLRYGRIANVLEREGPIEYVIARALSSPENSTDEAEAPPPVKVTIAKSPTHLSLRIRDRGGGISPDNLPHVFSYAFSTAGKSGNEDGAESGEDAMGPYGTMGGGGDDLGMLNGGGGSPLGQGALTSNLGTLSGLGYGLAMARIYSTWAPGGALDLVSLYGQGCDAYVKLPANLVEIL